MSTKLGLCLLLLLMFTSCTAQPNHAGNMTTRSTMPAVHWTTVGFSANHRPIRMTTIGHGPRRIFLIGAIHGDEPEGLAVLDELIDRFNQPRFAGLATIRVLRDMNPDGSAAGTRTNANGIDLNRNWPATNFRASAKRGRSPLSEPETRIARDHLLSFDPGVVVVFHSTRSGPFVNHDGPGAARLAEAFAQAARLSDHRWRVVEQMGYATPGSLGSYAGLDKQIPTLTIEFATGHDPARALESAAAGMEAIITMRE